MNNKVKFLRGTSDEYAVAEKDSDTIYFTTDDGKLYIGDKEISGSDIIIDDTLSDTSTNPVQNKVVKQAIDNKADKSLYGDTTINVGRLADSTVGDYSTSEGCDTTASGNYSHAEGLNTFASGNVSHAEGSSTIASGSRSHSEGSMTKAGGDTSHAEGFSTKASGKISHAEGTGTTASGYASHAEGQSTTASGDYSHAGGHHTQALKEAEFAHGKFNQSNEDTIYSIGDGTADDARHNAFEITTTGGKLHDKDIATTDLIPTSLPANGGNADTVGGMHADDFVSAAALNQIQIPSNVDVPAWIYANGKRYQRYMTNDGNIGLTNVPNDSRDWVWYWFDGINIFAREWATGKYYICDMINGNFSGWKDVYTSGYKPYVTGEVTITKANIATISLDFIPSFILYAKKDTLTQNLLLATHADIYWFRGNFDVDDIVYYIAFK